jgi:hypothetical protein
MRAAAVEFTGTGKPVPCVALRSAPGPAETADFVHLWGLALEAVEGKPRSVAEAIEWTERPLDDRMERAYPGVRLTTAPSGGQRRQFTLHACGPEPVRQLAALLRASIAAWPEPDWPAQVRREAFLREAFRAHAEGRTEDLRRLIDDFARISGIDPGTIG